MDIVSSFVGGNYKIDAQIPACLFIHPFLLSFPVCCVATCPQALFSAFVLYDTSKLITNAKLKKQWDPVNEQFSIYLDIINIFTRIAFMLAGNNRKK